MYQNLSVRIFSLMRNTCQQYNNARSERVTPSGLREKTCEYMVLIEACQSGS